jgi:hypothetical protein
MLEKSIEQRLRKRIIEVIPGALCLKLVCPGFTGVPDRLILIPGPPLGGRVIFVETKRPKDKERPRQAYVQQLLTRMGFMVFSAVNSMEKVEDVVSRSKSLHEKGLKKHERSAI